MAEKESHNNGGSSGQTGGSDPTKNKSKQTHGLWVIFLVFAVFVGIVFLTQRKETIDWVKDYQAGIKLATEQNKPILLTFFKQNIGYCTYMEQNTYNNAAVKKYVESNFIPIFIDVDKQPAIAKQYEVGYYPSHYVKLPDSEEIFGPRVGYDPPSLFIRQLKKLLAKARHEDVEE